MVLLLHREPCLIAAEWREEARHSSHSRGVTRLPKSIEAKGVHGNIAVQALPGTGAAARDRASRYEDEGQAFSRDEQRACPKPGGTAAPTLAQHSKWKGG
jgi:hypothetical protein